MSNILNTQKTYTESEVIDLIVTFATHVDEQYRPYTKNNMEALISVTNFVIPETEEEFDEFINSITMHPNEIHNPF